MKAAALVLTLLANQPNAADATPANQKQTGHSPTVVIVVGAKGTPEYGQEFTKWAERWQQSAETGGARVIQIGRDTPNGTTDHDRLHQTLTSEQRGQHTDLWLVLIGHGTFDGRAAKFNLRGPDVTAAELAVWLSAIKRPTAVINCASSSGPFISKLSAPGRVVISATKSGVEQNYARFGGYLSQTIADPNADLDKDGQTSLLEAYLMASRRTQEFYRTEGRLETEHSLLDDNGDAQGTRADWFRGIRPVRRPSGSSTVDGYRAHQFHLVRSLREQRMSPELRQQRDKLELAVIQLRDRKAALPEDEYYGQLEILFVQLAELYSRVKD